MLFKNLLINIIIIKLQAIQIGDCYYSKEDQFLTTLQEIPISKTFQFNRMNSQFNSIGFGIWTKYIPNIYYTGLDFPQRPFDDPICLEQSCDFNGFYFMKFLDQNENTIAAIILRMNDNPISLRHDIYVFDVNSEEFEMKQINFEANEYHSVWIFTSFIYQYQEQKIMFFTNYQNQLQIFEYQILTDSFSVILGGYKNDLSMNSVKNLNLLYFKGLFSNILDYGGFLFYEDFYKDLLLDCPLQTQYSQILSNNIIASIQPDYEDPYSIINLNLILIGKRYSFNCWIKQRYDNALIIYREQQRPIPSKLIQIAIYGTANQISKDIFNGDDSLILQYEVDLENNNKTKIFFKTYFLKIPFLTPVYREMEQYYQFTYESDNLYKKTQEWHYVIFDFGRNVQDEGQVAQLRLYFMNQEPIIKNFGINGFNSQFYGPLMVCFLFYPNSDGVKSFALMFDFIFTTGQTEDNNEKYSCHSSCLDCDGPYQNNCTKCNEQNSYFLTQFNRCECKYLYSLDQITQNCVPIEQTLNLVILQEDLEIPCLFGYFQFNFNNQFYCYQCPKNNHNSFICGDCYEQLFTWYIKPMCTFDYIQNSDDFVFIRQERKNQDIDIYFINQDLELILVEGASLNCEQNQIGCYKTKNYHLGQQMKIQCKINRYFNGNGCQYCDELCINCDETGNCLECQEQYYFDKLKLKCLSCPLECLSCITDFGSSKGYICKTCIKHYSVLEGYCLPCGMNCEYCSQDFDKLKQRNFLRCFSCINNNIMTIRINAIDCKIIYIENCIYPIMYSSVNFEINSLNSQFQPSEDFSIENFACSICQNGYLTNFLSCNPINQDFYGFCQSAVLLRIIQQGIDYGENLICILSNSTIATAIVIAEKCSIKSPNCYFCLSYLHESVGNCLECNQGYYADKLTGYCYTCPQDQNCRTCIQTSAGFDDQWKKWQVSFVQIVASFKSFDQLYDYRKIMQSQNPSDYKIICTTCYDGYILLNNICLKYCDKQCNNCVLQNGQFICQNCQQTTYTKVLSVIKNSCSSCPSYCEFCRERSKNELLILNPMFDVSKQDPIYSYQCLKPFQYQNPNLVYDSFIGQFQLCKNIQSYGCQNVLKIEMNLYCLKEDYQRDLNNQRDLLSQNLFKQKNILFESLIQNYINFSSFQQFESSEILLILSSKQVKKILLILETEQSQTCTVSSQSFIQQFFSKNLVNLIDVQLFIKAEENSILTIQIIEELSFLYFTKIQFENVKFNFETNIYQKKVIFQSFWPQIINFKNSIITTSNPNKSTYFQFIIQNLKSILLQNIKFIQINAQNNGNGLMILASEQQQSDQEYNIQFKNIEFVDSIFYNLTLFNFSINEKYSIIIEQLNIQSVFYFSKFTQFTSDYQIKFLQMMNLNIQGNFYNCKPFFSLEKIDEIFINNITLSNLKITDSIIFQVEKQVNLQTFLINSCRTSGFVSFIENNNNNQNSNNFVFKYHLFNISVINLSYGIDTKIINLKMLRSQKSEAKISLFRLINNKINLSEITKQESQLQAYLIILEQQIVIIDQIFISRGYGISEFLIQNALELTINNLYATASQFEVVHQFLECSNFYQFKEFYQNLLQLQDVQNITISDIFIEKMNFINNAMILVQRESIFSSQAEDLIQINNLVVTNTISILTEKNAQTALIKIFSNSKIIINISFCKFSKNQLHMYLQNTLMKSSVVLLFDCPSGIVSINNSQLINNFVTNGTDNIINVITNLILIKQVNFQNNSIFDAEVIKQNLDWDFFNGSQIQENNIKRIFPFINHIGNGFYKAEKVIIEDCIVNNSNGQNGIGFYIQSIETILQNIQFQNLQTFFQYNEENGACLYFYLTSDYCKISINNITLKNIFAQNYGGMIYIQSDFDHLQFNLSNLKIFETFSIIGSILYASFQKSSIYNQISIENLQIYNSQVGILKYLKNVKDIQRFQDFLANRVLIYLQNSIVILKKVIIENNFWESLFQGVNSGNLDIQDIMISNGQISYLSLIEIIPRQGMILFQLDQFVQIFFKNIFISNVSQFTSDISSCNISQYTTKIDYQNMQCNLKQKIGQIKLFSSILILDDYYFQIKYSQCLYESLIDQMNEEINSLILIKSIKIIDQIQFSDIIFEKNNISLSNSGLIYFSIEKQTISNLKIVLTDFKFIQNSCGITGCLNFDSLLSHENNNQETQNRQLQAQTDFLLAKKNPDIIIKKYLCLENQSNYGTCLYSNNLNVLIEKSIFSNNQAIKSGGAIYFDGIQCFLFLYKSIIQKNQAQIGGGVFYKNVLNQDQKKFFTLINQNQATYYGEDFAQAPQHLSITLNNYKSIFKISKEQFQTYFIREQIVNSHSNEFSPIFLPSGTPINQYKILKKETMELIPLNLTLRIVPLNSQFQRVKNLIGASCQINAKILNLKNNKIYENQNQILINNNFYEYNTISEDYNLDDLKIYFDSSNLGNNTLQLQVICSNMMIPIFDKNNFSIIDFHTNYTLLININTFDCRLGEIKSLDDFSCHECDTKLDQYSIQLNTNKCSFRDEQTTISVESFKLNLRPGYWRPDYGNNIIEHCLNLKESCLGGWNVGDFSCYEGQIGALCESCDLYNIRGDGHFSVTQQYSCASCNIIIYNIIQIIGFSCWTLITIILSVKGNITKSITYPQSPQLIKILTNYLQIINSLTTFKLNLPINLFVVINGIGTPNNKISNSMDCFLAEITSIEVHYAKLIWQIIIPCGYFSLLSIIYGLLIYFKKVQYRGSIVSTSLIYMYIYFQPSLIGSLIALISSRVVSGISWIQANMAYQFETYYHQKWVYMLCAPALTLFGIIIPLILFVSLYRIKDRLIYKKGKSLLGYLYYEYKPKAYFWEIVKIFNKQFLILFLIYYEDSIILKGSLVYILLFCYGQLNSFYQPFKQQKFNNLDFQSTAICGISIIFGIGLSIETKIQFQNISTIYFFTLLMINIYIICKLIYNILMAYTEEFEKSVEQIKQSISILLPYKLKKNQFCLRIIKSRVESRQRAFRNFKLLMQAYKKQKKLQKQNLIATGLNSLISLQTTYRFQQNERDKKQSEGDLMLLTQKSSKY